MQTGAAQRIRDKAGAEFLKRGWEWPDISAFQHHLRQSAKHQHTRQRDNKRWDSHIRDPKTLHCANHRANQQTYKASHKVIGIIADHHDRRHRASKRRHRANRKVNMPRHNHQQHPQRHHHNVAVLQNQVGDIERLEQNATGAKLKKQHNHEQRNQHSIFANVAFEQFHHGFDTRKSGGSDVFLLGCHCSMTSVCIIHFIIRSGDASATGISPTMRPSFIT